MSAKSYRSLTPYQRALVAMAVLLDGNEAVNFLGIDATMGEHFREAAEELTRDELEIRLPFIGTLYREAIADMSREDDY